MCAYRRHVTEMEKNLGEDELVRIKGAINVYVHRRHIIEAKRTAMGFTEYIVFYTELSSYYRQLGQDQDVVKCHKIITEQIDTHIDMCRSTCQSWPFCQCDFHTIGRVYSEMSKYGEAYYYFILSFEMENDTVTKAAILQEMKATQSELASPLRLYPRPIIINYIYDIPLVAFLKEIFLQLFWKT